MSFAELLADNLRALRLQAGMSQEELAAAAGLDRTAVSRFERCVRMPRADTLITLADALGIDVADLLAGAGEHSRSRPISK